jgi:NADPH2:quinone reductase
MKAAYINQPGPPESIIYGDLPDPQPKSGEVLVRVRAVSVNPIDTYLRSGAVKAPLPSPYILGCDLAGVVELSPSGSRFKSGDRVWATNQGQKGRQGTFAELAAVNDEWLYPTPDNVSDEQAAALALVAITAYLGLVRTAKAKAGDSLYISGGSGGVGSAVIQIAKAHGVRVITTAGSDEKVADCLKLGADAAINYKTADIDAEIRKFAPDGLSIYWDTVREPNFERAVSLLGMRGRIIVMAGRDAKPIFPIGPFYTRDCSLHGFAIFNASPDEQRAAADDLNRLISEGMLHARIDRVLPLSEAADAHRLQEDNTLRNAGTLAGKIVLTPS